MEYHTRGHKDMYGVYRKTISSKNNHNTDKLTLTYVYNKRSASKKTFELSSVNKTDHYINNRLLVFVRSHLQNNNQIRLLWTKNERKNRVVLI